MLPGPLERTDGCVSKPFVLTGTSGDLSTTFRWGPSRDPPEISQDPFESLENTALADAGALKGPSRDSPGTLRDLSMDADQLPVGMVAFGSVAYVIVINISHIHIYIYIYMHLCIYTEVYAYTYACADVHVGSIKRFGILYMSMES